MFRKLTEQKLVTVVAKGEDTCMHFQIILCHCSISCICVFCFSELVPVSKAMPVCLFEVSEHTTECLSSIGEILVTKGLASLSKQYLQYIPEVFSVESIYTVSLIYTVGHALTD